MARFQHTVTLAPVPRRLLESCVGTLHDLAEDTRAQDTAAEDAGAEDAADGRSRTGPTFTVLAWDRRRETAVEVVTEDHGPDHRVRLVCALGVRSAARPREAWLTATLRTGGGKGRNHLEGTARLRLDLGGWWQATGGRRRTAASPLSGTLTHALARATVTAAPQPAPDGRWRETVRARVRGRSFARPLLAVAALLLRARARRTFAEALDDAAERWNAHVPAWVDAGESGLRATLTDAVRGAHGAGSSGQGCSGAREAHTAGE
ncbi:hypothetical protein ACW7N6_02320 [Streptomyces sp. UC1A3]